MSLLRLPIAPGTYAIDSVHSQLSFAVQHLDISSVRGTFDRYSGALFVGESLAETVVVIEAEMGSINSGNALRDEHVQGNDYLAVDDHPQMLFRSTSITPSGNDYSMTGDLTIRGVTLPLTLHVVYNGSGIFPVDGSTHHGFTATGTISRSAFGVSTGAPVVSDEVRLTLDVQFVEPAAES
jgi:polyisoprenoid-binding protein YceI